MGGNTPKISVIIVSYNVWSYLQACIKSVMAQSGVNTEIIVIDNNSLDGSITRIQQEFPGVKLIANKENKGFSAANNQGINLASGEYVLLLNPDTEIKQNDCLLNLCKALDSYNKGGIVAPCLLNTDGSFQPSFWTTSFLSQLFLELFYLHLFAKKEKPTKAINVQAASGASLLFEKALVKKTGALDENMFWMEDIDFCYRVRKTGGEILYNPDTEVIHHGGKSSTNYAVVLPNQVMSKVKFYKKNGSVIQYAALTILSLVFIISRWFAFAVLSLTFKKVFAEKRKAYGVAVKGYFKYYFSGNKAIINI